jgi:hypothetical protein
MAPTMRAKNRPTLLQTLKVCKAQERAVQKLAFNELLQRPRTNGGKLDHGDILKIIKDYLSIGQNIVTRRNLRYCLTLYDKEGQAIVASEHKKPTGNIKITVNTSLSLVTFNNSNNDNEVLDKLVDVENVDNNVEENNTVAMQEK